MRRFLITCALLAAVVFSSTAQDRRGLLLKQNSGTNAVSSPTPELLHYKFNAGSGTALLDSSTAAGANGTTDAAWVTGKSGSGFALDFNGTSHDAVTGTTIAYATNVIALSMWTYFDATNGAQVLVESSANFNSANHSFIVTVEDGKFNTVMFATGASYHTEYCAAGATGVWKHWFVLFDRTLSNGDTRVWLDGAEQSMTASGVLGGSADFGTQTLYIGARGGSSLFYNGRMDDLRIYSGDRNSIVSTVVADPQ